MQRSEETLPVLRDGESDEEAVLNQLVEGYSALTREIHKVVVGQDEVIESVLCCMLAGGHCLVQGVPGLAKTLLVTSLSRVLRMTFNRIQFTPDLMPSDITGTDIIQQNPKTMQPCYNFVRGPIFANVVLADEINRTPPKTQAALLQAMQERQVTTSGTTYELPKPFFVLATQNPIEQEGTYNLPEAALDRFMFMTHIDYPPLDDECDIVKRTTTGRGSNVEPVLDAKHMLQFQEIVRMAPVSDAVIKYGVYLARATRPEDPMATDMVGQYFKWGGGPRAGQFMTLAAKARALIHGRVTAGYDDVRAVCKPVLRHRVTVNFNAEADGIAADTVLDDLITKVHPPK
ncbi:MAG TPA: MoxR family ATPase [Sedimentisphaerales bacterium]|nr:MoxR family ATPase [Sedimentisphaerales bacterium]